MSTENKQQGEDKPQWLQKKEEGNAAYRDGEVDSAIDLYTQALSLAETHADDKDRGLLLCNRAQCFIRKGEYESTVEDCTTCLTLSKNNVKALFRRATALEKLGRLNEALRDYMDARELTPGHAAIEEAIVRIDPSKGKKSNQSKSANDRQGQGQQQIQIREEDYKEFSELDARVKEVARQIASTRDKQRMTERQKKQLELTKSAIQELGENTRTYRSLGKSFLLTPRDELQKQLGNEVAESEKKMKVTEDTLKYLDRQQKEADSAFMEYVRTLQQKQQRG
eukprot:gb/GECG01003287.1/.p1 GENE.gb/GECG01003287.1/~~gb/GECG01003287.1/.p1  ORF type:complete len:281 (+),score=61.85 gb/GECG01003287.1/:1-843(+)